MDIAREYDLFAFLAGCEHHGLDGGSGSPDHEECVAGLEGFSRKFFGFLNDRGGMAEIVERLHRIDVQFDTLLSEKSDQFGIAASSLMSWDVKRHDPVLPEFF